MNVNFQKFALLGIPPAEGGIALTGTVSLPVPGGVLFDDGGTWITVHGHPVHIGDKGGAGGGTQGGAKAAPSSGGKKTPEQKAEEERIKKERNERVMAKLPHVAAVIPKVREQVESDIHKDDAAPERVAAAVTKIMDATTMRVGSEENATKIERGAAKGKNSFGASSLRKRHVTVNGDTVTFRFAGKSRKSWNRSVTDPALAAVVRHLQSLPGERLMQYHEGGPSGPLKPFTETHAREYLEPHGITPKNFRTYHATRLAREHLETAGTPRTTREAEQHVSEAIKAVSEHLGNTPAIARESYIHPQVIADHIAKAGSSAGSSGSARMSWFAGKGAESAIPGTPAGGIDHASEQKFNEWLEGLLERLKSGEVSGDDPAYEGWDPDAAGDEDGEPDDADEKDVKMSGRVTVGEVALFASDAGEPDDEEVEK